MRAALVLLAGGSGRRSGHAVNKVYLPLAGRPVLAWSLRAAGRVADFTQYVIVVRASGRSDPDASAAAEAFNTELPGRPVRYVSGGATRHASEWAALQSLAEEIRSGALDVVVIHDGARPLAPSDLYRQVIDAASARGGAIPTRPLSGAVRVDGGPGHESPSQRLVTVQTPQAFRAAPLLAAYEAAEHDGFEGGDTAACVERYADLDVAALPGPAYNLKITYPGDLGTAERLVSWLASERTPDRRV